MSQAPPRSGGPAVRPLADRLRSLVRRMPAVRHPRSWTLRSRLVIGLVTLLVGISIAIGIASVALLRGYLMDRLDNQLQSATARSAGVITQYLEGAGTRGPAVPPSEFLGLGQTPGTIGAVIQHGTVIAGVLDKSVATRGISLQQQKQLLQVPVDGNPRTVELGGELGAYRVVVTPLAGGVDLLIGLPLTDVTSTIGRLELVVFIVTVAGLVAAAGVGLLIVRLAVRPLDRVAATATSVTNLRLDRGDVTLAERVPDADTDTRTEVGRVGAALNRMLAHVASAFAARESSENRLRQFVADASHELRTPLASIRGYAELTHRGGHQLPADVSHSLDRIESESKRMTSLVDDLLLLARLDSGRDLGKDAVDLSALLVDVVSDAHAAGPDHTWSLDLPEEPVVVPGDAARLHQVVANLLGNARSHTPPGTSVEVALAGADDGGAVIRVSDDGPGIDQSVREHLFERFARGDESRSRSTGSTGLGLAIVQAVVAAHGGTVTAESHPGATTFTVTLPGESVTPTNTAMEPT